MQTFFVQVQLGQLFEDFYVAARNRDSAINKVRKLIKGTALDHRFVNFVA